MNSSADKKVETQYFLTICNWLEKTAALHFPASKQATLLSRLYALCQKHGIPDIKALAFHIKNGDIPGLKIELIDVATTNHTFFFREEATWNYFRSHIIPTLEKKPAVRIWSAASSSGEEAYTFAMYLSEHIGITQASKKVAILGTDISQSSLETAQRGIYRSSVVKSVDDELKGKYFKQISDYDWQIDPALSQMCTFRRMNLKATQWPFSKKFQLIACRNVLYYFNQEDQTRIVNKLHDQIEPGGYLLTSVTESLRDLKSPWKLIQPGVYQSG